MSICKMHFLISIILYSELLSECLIRQNRLWLCVGWRSVTWLVWRWWRLSIPRVLKTSSYHLATLTLRHDGLHFFQSFISHQFQNHERETTRQATLPPFLNVLRMKSFKIYHLNPGERTVWSCRNTSKLCLKTWNLSGAQRYKIHG